jgi:RNA polymerase sigma factor (sigma-70 family)
VRAVAAAVLRLPAIIPTWGLRQQERCASHRRRQAASRGRRSALGDRHRDVALDMLRAKKRTRLGEDLGDEDASSWAERVPDSSPGPHELLERAEGRAALERAVAELPIPMQAALRKFHVDGKSYQTISEEMKVPLGTVATWVTRGRKSVTDRLRAGGKYE